MFGVAFSFFPFLFLSTISFKFVFKSDVLQSTTPKVLDSKTNSKRDVEKELMRAVDRFVSTNLHTLLAPLIAFLTKASAFLTVRSTPESAKTAEGKTAAQSSAICSGTTTRKGYSRHE